MKLGMIRHGVNLLGLESHILDFTALLLNRSFLELLME